MNDEHKTGNQMAKLQVVCRLMLRQVKFPRCDLTKDETQTRDCLFFYILKQIIFTNAQKTDFIF